MEVIEGYTSSIARLSRATGINLVLGIQRPDANVLTGQIKNNIPIRISGRFADNSASEIVLGNTMAVDLPDIKGRFLYRLGNEIVPFQAYYFDDDTMLDEEVIQVSDTKTVDKQKKRNNKKQQPVLKENNKYYEPTNVVEETDPSIFDEKITWSAEEKKLETEDEVTLDLEYSDYDFNYSEVDSGRD